MHSELQQVELFAIQRCWFSGPHIEPSVDCHRLFTSRREAEEVAYHSAHAYANQSIQTAQSLGTRQQFNGSVRTTLLPQTSPNGRPSSSHAFQTCGKLFWVRSLQATIVPHVATSQSAGLTYPVHVPTLAAATANQNQTGAPFTSAEVIFTENIIGGTGNPNSRRGSEIPQGRVVVSTDPSYANRRAVEAARHLHLSMAHNPNVKISVVCVPIGKAHLGQNTHDWPAAPTVVNGHHYLQQQQQQEMPMQMGDEAVKRDWEEQQQHVENNDPRATNYQNQIHQDQQQQQGQGHFLRPSKRQCHAFHRQESPHKQEAASDVPCSMMFG